MKVTKEKAILLSLGAVWLSIIAGSIFAPDMVSGSQQEHLPIVAIIAWIWGAVASGLIASLVLVQKNQPVWSGFAFSIIAIWLAVLLVTVFSPSFVTGSDPTTIPLAGIISPMVGMAATAYVCLFVPLVILSKRKS